MKYTFAVVWGLLVTAAAFSQDRPKLNKGQVDQYEVACGTDALSCWTLGEDYLYSKHDGQTASVFLGMAKEKGYRNSVKYDQVGDEYLRLNDWKTLDPGGTAYHWYQDAADLGDPAAQTHLADFYSKPGPYYNPPYASQWYKIAADNPQTKLAAAQLAAVIAEQQRQDALNAERAQAERQQAEQARQQAIADGTYQEPEEKESRASRFLGVVTAAIDVAAAATGTDLNADSTPANYTPQRSDSSSSGSSSSTSNSSTPSGPNASICGRAINEATARANNCHY